MLDSPSFNAGLIGPSVVRSTSCCWPLRRHSYNGLHCSKILSSERRCAPGGARIVEARRRDQRPQGSFTLFKRRPDGRNRLGRPELAGGPGGGCFWPSGG